MREFDWIEDLTVITLAILAVQYAAIKLKIHGTSGLILAGIFVSILGPNGVNFIGDVVVGEIEVIHLIAEIAIGFLLLEVGMELSFHKILRMWKKIFIGGAFQMILTSVVIVFAYQTFYDGNLKDVIFLGILVAMSSTVVIFKWLQDNNLFYSAFGSFLVGVLLFQDISLLPLAMIVPIFADGGASISSVAIQILVSVFTLGLVFTIEYNLVHHFLAFAREHHNKHFFKLAVAAICLLNVTIMSYFNLSPALGMFLSGLLISGTQYRSEIFGNVEKFTGLLTPCFFIYIGTLFNPQLLLAGGSVCLLVLVCFLSIWAIKLLSGFIVARSLKLKLGDSIRAGGALAQVGELSFVLAGLGLTNKVLDQSNFDILVLLIVLSILLTPLTIKGAEILARTVEQTK